MRRHARYGPPDRYQPPPGAGMCIGVFAVVREAGNVLIGIPKRNRRWTAEWVPAWRVYPKKELQEVWKQSRLPSTYLWEGEHPNAALKRVMRDQLRMNRFKSSNLRVFSYMSPSDWYPGNHHWDLVFVYDVRADVPTRKPPWWRELSFVAKKDLKGRDWGWNDDMMRDLKLLKGS